MAKRTLPGLGEVYERTFCPVVEESELVEALGRAKKKGTVGKFLFSEDSLTVWRSWVEGTNAEVEFDRYKGPARSSNSHHFFRNVYRLLPPTGHGALHPGNIILRSDGGGFELVDAEFNSVVLYPAAGTSDNLWMWGQCVPKGWVIADWDLVSLLRTAVLLDMDHAEREALLSNQEVKVRCRRWARQARKIARDAPNSFDTHYLNGLKRAVQLLLRVPEVFECSSSQVPRWGRSKVEQGSAPAESSSQDQDSGEVSAMESNDNSGGSQPSLAAQKHRKVVSVDAVTRLVALRMAQKRVSEQELDLGGSAEKISKPKNEEVAPVKPLSVWTHVVSLAQLVLVLSIAAAGLWYTRYYDVFAYEGEDILEGLYGPEGPGEVELSALMAPPASVRKVVYIFAIDISKSLFKFRAEPVEVGKFRQRLKVDSSDDIDLESVFERCGLNADKVTKFELARAQICYYLHAIPSGVEAGLWRFGKSPSLVSSRRSLLVDGSPRERDAGRSKLIEQLMSLSRLKNGEVEANDTDFQAFFEAIFEEYVVRDGFEGAELRLMIASDFLHDVRGEGGAGGDFDTRKLEKRLNELKKRALVTYRLLEIVPDVRHPGVVDVLPVIEKCNPGEVIKDSLVREETRPYSYFLHGYQAADRKLVFRHKSGSEDYATIKIDWDDQMSREKDDSKLIVGLLPSADGESAAGPAIFFSEGRPKEECSKRPAPVGVHQESRLQWANLLPGKTHEFSIRPGDHICMSAKPMANSQNFTYHLTLSLASDRAQQTIHVVAVKFRPFVSRFAAWTIVSIIVMVLLKVMYHVVNILMGAAVYWKAKVRETEVDNA